MTDAEHRLPPAVDVDEYEGFVQLAVASRAVDPAGNATRVELAVALEPDEARHVADALHAAANAAEDDDPANRQDTP